LNISNPKFYTQTIPGVWQFGKALYKGEITFDDLKRGLDTEFIYPFRHLKDNYDQVIDGKPTNKEAYDYGYYAGSVVQIIAGAVTLGEGLAVKLASKAPKLMKIIPRKPIKCRGKVVKRPKYY
jgi:hypothetical protein